MKITLQQRGESTIYDLTDYLLEEGLENIASEFERAAFERVYEDARISFSNIDGYFTDIFSGTPATARFVLTLWEGGRKLFLGELDNDSVPFNISKEQITLVAFSFNKIFWDECKKRKLRRSYSSEFENNTFVTVLDVLTKDILNEFTSLNIQNLDLRNGFGERRIRSITHDATEGDEGRYSELDPDTTVEDLLKAMEIFYNAEFYIDYESMALVMDVRNEIISDTQTSIDDTIHEDSIEVWLSDEEKYDYLYGMIGVPKPKTPEFQNFINLGYSLSTAPNFLSGSLTVPFQYRITNVYLDSRGIEVESPTSEVLEVNIPGSFQVGETAYSYNPSIKFLAESSNVIKRNVYRTVITIDYPVSYGILYKVFEISGYAQTTFTDNVGGTVNEDLQLIPQSPAEAGWVSYDETTGQWGEVIYDNQDGINRPDGKIFEAIPSLRFVEGVSRNPIGPSLYQIYCFFGKDNPFEAIVNSWKRLLISRRRLKCRVEGIDFRIGDSVMVSKIPDLAALTNGKFYAKRAGINLIEEQTDLELVSVI